MSKICQITGKRGQNGNKVSHANNKNKRRFEINLIKKKFFLPSSGKWITLKVTPHGMRIIDKISLEEAIKKAKYKGYIKK